VLCLHGLTGTPWEVRPPAEALAAAGFACYGPVLPGHGTTPEQLAETSGDRWVEGALAAYDRLSERHERVYVLGLSMGGVLALSVASRRPVAGLAVLAAPLQLGWVSRTGAQLLHRWVRFLPKTPAIADPEARAVHPGYDRMPLPAVVELVRLGRRVTGELDDVSAPLLLVYSRSDPTVPGENAERIQSGVGSRDCEVHWLSRSAHVLPVDLERVELAERVTRFVQRLEQGAAGGALRR
jgi:carboxylesterase